MNRDNYIRYRNIRCKSTTSHKFRTNKFGITWCVVCGLLYNRCNFIPETLKEKDKIYVEEIS